MAITQAELDAVETEIKELNAANFSSGGLSIDQEKRLSTLMSKYEWMKKQLKTTLTFGKSYIDGIDA